MRATRRTQPHRGGRGPAGAARSAMRKGRPAYMAHPSTAKRRLQKGKRRARRLYSSLRGYR